MRMIPVASRLSLAISIAAASSGCLALEAVSREQAAAERPAIDRVVMQDSGTFRTIASRRAKAGRVDLADRTVACSIASVDVQFVSEIRATYTMSYTCGTRPWREGDAPVATPEVKLDVIKESAGWFVNAVL